MSRLRLQDPAEVAERQGVGAAAWPGDMKREGIIAVQWCQEEAGGQGGAGREVEQEVQQQEQEEKEKKENETVKEQINE